MISLKWPHCCQSTSILAINQLFKFSLYFIALAPTTVVQTTIPPAATFVTTSICEMLEGMENPTLLPDASIVVSSNAKDKSGMRLGNKGWTSWPNDKTPSLHIDFPGDEALMMGSIEFPVAENVKSYKVFIKPEAFPRFVLFKGAIPKKGHEVCSLLLSVLVQHEFSLN